MSIPEFFAHVAKTQGIEPTEVQTSINLTFFALPLTLMLQWHGPGDAKNSQAAPSHTATVPGVFVAFFFSNGHIYSHLLQSPQIQLFTPSVSVSVLFPSRDGKSCSQPGYQIRFWPSGPMALGRFSEKLPLNSAVEYGTYPGNKSFTACCCQTYWRLLQPSSIPPSGWCLGPQITLKSSQNQALNSRLKSFCQQHQNWTENGSLPTCSSIWGTGNWRIPPSTVYLFSLAGPKCFQTIPNSKNNVQD